MAVVAVLIASLYLLAMACQGGSGGGDAESGRSGPVAWLGDRVGGFADADPDEVTADCRQSDGQLWFDDRCVLTVAPSDRSLRLVPVSAQAALLVTAPAPVGDFTLDSEVAAGEVVRVAVGSDGAQIELSCLDDEGCGIRIGAEDG